jgi:hypothetical protein
MKANVKKGLIITGVLITLGVSAYFIWSANKKKKEEEEANDALEQASSTQNVSVGATTTPASSSTSTQTSGIKTGPIKQPAPPNIKPSAPTRYAYAKVRGVVYADNAGTPSNVRILEYPAKDFIGVSTGATTMLGGTKFLKVVVKGSNKIGWTPAGFVNLTTEFIK